MLMNTDININAKLKLTDQNMYWSEQNIIISLHCSKINDVNLIQILTTTKLIACGKKVN